MCGLYVGSVLRVWFWPECWKPAFSWAVIDLASTFILLLEFSAVFATHVSTKIIFFNPLAISFCTTYGMDRSKVRYDLMSDLKFNISLDSKFKKVKKALILLVEK